jgi:hypothetical protein
LGIGASDSIGLPIEMLDWYSYRPYHSSQKISISRTLTQRIQMKYSGTIKPWWSSIGQPLLYGLLVTWGGIVCFCYPFSIDQRIWRHQAAPEIMITLRIVISNIHRSPAYNKREVEDHIAKTDPPHHSHP